MSAFREFALDDLLKFNQIVFDPMVDVYSLSFYMERLLKYPHLSEVAVGPNACLTGYIFGSRESYQKKDQENISQKDCPSHSHVTSFGMDHNYRRLGVGSKLLERFHQASELQSDLYVDLFVREKNKVAIELYESFGYVKYRWLRNYYKDYQHAYDMRLPLRSDVEKKCLEGRMMNKN